jgi:hypothetical protein
VESSDGKKASTRSSCAVTSTGVPMVDTTISSQPALESGHRG